MLSLSFAISFLMFWLYTKLIYHKSVVEHRHLIAAHFIFIVINPILWDLPTSNLPYWVVVPLLLNSTRIELWYESLMIHANNLGYAQLITLKNAIPIVWVFHCADKVNYNSGVVMSIVLMDVMHWVMHTVHQTKYIRWTENKNRKPLIATKSSYLTFRTIKYD